MEKLLSMVTGAVLFAFGSTSVSGILPPKKVFEPPLVEVTIEQVVELKETNEFIASYIEKMFPEDTRLMSRIAKCESGLRHFNEDGSVVVGRQTPDVGLFQISPKHWETEAKKLGFDIYSLEGNTLMARHIYEVQGLGAWQASFSCWKKTN